MPRLFFAGSIGDTAFASANEWHLMKEENESFGDCL